MLFVCINFFKIIKYFHEINSLDNKYKYDTNLLNLITSYKIFHFNINLNNKFGDIK